MRLVDFVGGVGVWNVDFPFIPLRLGVFSGVCLLELFKSRGVKGCFLPVEIILYQIRIEDYFLLYVLICECYRSNCRDFTLNEAKVL